MRKLIFLLVACFAFISCNDEDSYGIDSYVITISKTDWERVGGVNEEGSYFRCIVEDFDLTNSFLQNGALNVYMYLDTGLQTPLPFVEYQSVSGYDWTTIYDYDFSKYEIAFYVTLTDYDTKEPPSSITFRVVKQYQK